MTTNILTVPVSISFCHKTNYKNIDITINSYSTNTTLSTTTDAVHEKSVGISGKESAKNSQNNQNSIVNVAVDDDAQ